MNKQVVILLLNISISILAVSPHDHEVKQIDPSLRATHNHFAKATTNASSPAQEFPVEFRKIIMDSAPKEIKEIIDTLKDPKSLERTKVKRILLHGPSGTGKTTLAQVFAQEINRPCIFINAGLLGNEYQNSVAQNLDRVVEQAIKIPCVLVIDEIDAIIKPSKIANNEDVPRQVWGILDKCAKLSHVIIIGTTNNIKGMEKPLQTRFSDEIVEIPLGSLEVRKKIISFYLNGILHDCRNEYFHQLASKSKEFSNREIEKLVNGAIAIAQRRKSVPFLVIQNDFEEAFKKLEKKREGLAEQKETWLDKTKNGLIFSGKVAFPVVISKAIDWLGAKKEVVEKVVEAAPAVANKMTEIAPTAIKKITELAPPLLKKLNNLANSSISKFDPQAFEQLIRRFSGLPR